MHAYTGMTDDQPFRLMRLIYGMRCCLLKSIHRDLKSKKSPLTHRYILADIHIQNVLSTLGRLPRSF